MPLLCIPVHTCPRVEDPHGSLAKDAFKVMRDMEEKEESEFSDNPPRLIFRLANGLAATQHPFAFPLAARLLVSPLIPSFSFPLLSAELSSAEKLQSETLRRN